eukprot:5626112-Heterocapsa_arctica.AAC.1
MPVCFLQADDLALQKVVEDGDSFDGCLARVWAEQPSDVPADEVCTGKCGEFSDAAAKLVH